MQAEVYCPLLLFFAAYVGAQTIEIHDLDKKNIQSSCETGMITQMDRYVLNADVDFTHASNNWFKTIVFEIKNPDSPKFVQLCLLNLENGCRDIHCYCEKKPTTKQTTYRIIINTTAFVDNSEAEIRGVLMTVNRKLMYSNTVKLPVIYDLSKRVLKVNNLTISSRQSFYQLKQTDRRIEFCCLNTPSPCVTTVVANHSATTTGDRCTVIDVPLDAGFDAVTVVTTICHNHTSTQSIMLETENIASTPDRPYVTDLSSKNETLESDVKFSPCNFEIIFFVIPATLIILIPVILITVFRVFRNRFKSDAYLRKSEEKQSKEKYITDNRYAKENGCENTDSEESLIKAIHLKVQPSDDMSDQANTHTTLENGTVNTTITMSKDVYDI